MNSIYLSKSSFIKGIQCHKALYFKKYHPEWEDEVSQAQQAIFDTGHNIGFLAQQLFSGGVDLGAYIPNEINKVFAKTEDLIKQKSIVYEAGFSFDNNLCFLDILVPNNNKWLAYEVKGSTEVKDVYLWDAAFQYYLMINSGLDVEDMFIVHINNQYERLGELDIKQLFIIESVLDRILPLQGEIASNIKILNKMLVSKKTPNIDIGLQCGKPYPCSFMGHCWQHIPDYSIFNISRLKYEKKFELYNQGVFHVKDVPDNYPLSKNQLLQIQSEKNRASYINKKAIRKFVNSLSYPLYFLDFETFNPAVPLFDHSRPYQQITFQYSLHIQNIKGGRLIHKEFLANTNGDPRLLFIEQLIKDLGKSGDILVYSSFEKSRLKEIAENFPVYENAINDILERIIDMMVIFSRKDYYTPEMKGSYSIKSVLPALVPGFGYDGLDIADGGSASIAFANLYYEKEKAKIDKTRDNLLAYCKMDTLAMVEIMKVLITI